MIEYRKGNILNSGAAALVNPVNAVGVSGKGLALAIKNAFPAWERVYSLSAKRGEIMPGKVWRYRALEGPLIYAFPTKAHWRDPSRIEWIRDGLDSLTADVCGEFGPSSIAIPALGCGLGGLRYEDVRPLIHAAAEKMSKAGVDAWIYEPK